MKIAEKLKKLQPYTATKEISGIKLDANESFLTLPDEIMEKVNTTVKNTVFNRYPDPSADELCRAAADFYGVKREQVVAGNGSDELISVIVNSFLEKGSKIMVTKPDFSMYSFYAEMAEAQIISLDKCDMVLDVEYIISRAKEEKPTLLFFSNPCNPTGNGIKREEVIKIAESLPDTLVVVDEAYMDFWNESIISDINKLSNVLILKTCSKAFGLAGLRVGFALGKEELIDLIFKAKSPFNVNSISQAIASTVLKEKEYLTCAIKEIVKSKESLEDKLKALCKDDKFVLLPSYTNFVLVKTEFADIIFSKLEEKGIVIRKFPDMLRITAGSEEENAVLVRALCEILETV